MMAERPIIFSGAMVNAILNGSKTQTRRVIKPQPLNHDTNWFEWRGKGNDGPKSIVWNQSVAKAELNTAPIDVYAPYQFGYLLWVRETFDIHEICGKSHVVYRADCGSDGDGAKWKPSIFMPRWASRITLRVTNVRAERLQDISEEDARAEGCSTETIPFIHGVDIVQMDIRSPKASFSPSVPQVWQGD